MDYELCVPSTGRDREETACARFFYRLSSSAYMGNAKPKNTSVGISAIHGLFHRRKCLEFV